MPENRTQNWLRNSYQNLIAKEMWPLNSPEFTPPLSPDYQVLGNVRGLSQSLSTTVDDRRTRGNAASDSLTQCPMNRAVRVFKATQDCVVAKGGYFRVGYDLDRSMDCIELN